MASNTSHTLYGKYCPIEMIGRGSFGNIWKVYDIKTTKEYAIKMVKKPKKLTPEKQQKKWALIFIREGKKIINLNNIRTNEMGKSFIINCKELLFTNNKSRIYPCIVMELFGHSLTEYMKRKSQNGLTISVPSIRIISIQILSAMSFLHGIGKCVHSDLKSDNILIDDSCQHFPKIKIIDFGNFISTKKSNEKMTSFNIQTLWYRAPEVLLGNSAHISTSIDLWSVGCILYELLSVHNGRYDKLFRCQHLNKLEVISKIKNELSAFPTYVYNTFNSYSFISDPQLYDNETSYAKLKTRRVKKLISKLGLRHRTSEFTDFVDLLSCLLDLNPYTRYTSEDAMRHKFIINDYCSAAVKRVHPIIKTTNDLQRQGRIDQSVIHFIDHLTDTIDSPIAATFPPIIAVQSLY